MVARYEIFKKALEVPGDIVECVIFKGTGVAYWLKLIDGFRILLPPISLSQA